MKNSEVTTESKDEIVIGDPAIAIVTVDPPQIKSEPVLLDAVGDPIPTPAPLIDSGYGWSVTKWYNLDNYKCNSCAWDTVGDTHSGNGTDAIAEHIYLAHILPNGSQGVING